MSHLKRIAFSGNARKSAHSTTLYPGRRYYVENRNCSVLNSTQSVLGNYRITTKCAEIVPLIPQTATAELSSCFFWDSDVDVANLKGGITPALTVPLLRLSDCHLKTNHLQLNDISLNGPEVIVCGECTELTLTPRFDVSFVTDSHAARLGAIHLVQSTRIITLENGFQISLLDTGHEPTPVLYLESRLDDQPIKLIAIMQEQETVREYSLTPQISQRIPEELDGVAVETVTVLEQYHSYFMQRPVTTEAAEAVWIPVYAPITWGWSVRVGRRPDGE